MPAPSQPAAPPPPARPLASGPALWAAVCGLSWFAALVTAPALASEQIETVQAPAPAADLPLARFVVETPDADALMPLLARVLEAAGVVDPFDPEDDERQLRRIRNSTVDVLATEGYFSPRMTIQADVDQRSKYVVRLDPGTRTRVAQVEIALKGAIEQQPERLRELAESWDLDIGQPFRDSQWSAAKTRLLARVKERDYPAARLVDSAADIDADEAQARLRLQIDSGPAFTLGELQLVKELKRYDRKLVERFNDIKPGERYDAGRLLDMQRRLQSAPYFSTVLVDVDIDPAKPDNVPILLDLTEGRSKRISTALGFSTNTGPRVEATYRQVGLFGFPYTLQTGAGYDKTRSVGYADILLPPKPNGALDSLGVLGERTDIQNFKSERWAAGVARATTTDGQADAQGRNYDTRLSLKLQRETTKRRVSALEREEAARIGVPIEGPRTNDTLSLSYSWTRRTVDSITDPRRGDVLTLVGATGIGRTGLSDLLSQSFVYGYGRYVRYFPVFDRHQLILRGEVGHVVVDDLRFVPLEFRFRAGGAGSVRGYQYQELGAREGAAVIGTDSLVIGSAEYVHWFTNTWGGALFYDVGDADNELLDVKWAKGYGAGARWRTIAGPLALDVAYGERDKKWRVHFTIAVAF